MLKPKEEETSLSIPIPIEMQELLDQFKDIICDGAPPNLPPKIATSHHIDFIPRASLPNKIIYKMTL